MHQARVCRDKRRHGRRHGDEHVFTVEAVLVGAPRESGVSRLSILNRLQTSRERECMYAELDLRLTIFDRRRSSSARVGRARGPRAHRELARPRKIIHSEKNPIGKTFFGMLATTEACQRLYRAVTHLCGVVLPCNVLNIL